MAIIRRADLRVMAEEDLRKKAAELRLEVAKERGKVKVGGVAENPGRVREARRTLARIETMLNEKKRKMNAAKTGENSENSGKTAAEKVESGVARPGKKSKKAGIGPRKGEGGAS